MGSIPILGSIRGGTTIRIWIDDTRVLTSVHCNPNKLRHTCATRLVTAGAPMFQLQQAGGWR